MPNQGFFELGLVDVENQPVRDPDVRVVLFGGASPRREIRTFREQAFPPRWHRLVVPAYPTERVLSCDIVPSRFRPRASGFFSLTDGETVRRDLTLFREPERWSARFTSWTRLSSAFDSLQRSLNDSTEIVLKSGSPVGRFTEGVYDQASDESLRLAKACLLNLFTKLSQMVVPGESRNWFAFVERILVIDRERFVAIVDEEMARIVRAIKDAIADFPQYKHTAAENHHGNLPARFEVPKSKMYSIKSKEDEGNVQLTIGPGTDPATGDPLFLLDADIDENGKLFAHLVDIFKHKFTGGTHPFDIREFLALKYPKADLGYALV